MDVRIGGTVHFMDPDGDVRGRVTDFDPQSQLIEIEWEDMKGDTTVFFLRDLLPKLRSGIEDGQ